MTQPQMQAEKRNTRRFAFNLPVMVKKLGGGNRELQGYTRDVSSRGAFVYLSSEAEEGTTIEFVMTLPAEVTMAEPIRVSCSGRVLRGGHRELRFHGRGIGRPRASRPQLRLCRELSFHFGGLRHCSFASAPVRKRRWVNCLPRTRTRPPLLRRQETG
jgi:hypothetical protein